MKFLELPVTPPAAARPNENGALRTVLYVSCVAALGGLLFGYDSAVINGAVGAIGSHFHANPTVGLS
jgi:hypothetical protein